MVKAKLFQSKEYMDRKEDNNRNKQTVTNALKEHFVTETLPSDTLFQFIAENSRSIRGIGCDIIEIHRVEEILSRLETPFLHRIFTEKELQLLAPKNAHRTASIAARFAAKEALAKALGTGIGALLTWHDMEITQDSLGKPSVIWSTASIERLSIGTTYLSLSHSTTHAIAFCVVLKKEPD